MTKEVDRRRITVVGAGGIGGAIAGHLERAGDHVLVVDRNAAHIDAIKERGLTVRTPDSEFVVHPRAARPEELNEPLEIVLLAVKAQHTSEAVALIASLLGAASYVVSVQNGLCESVIAELIGAERTVGAFVNFAADFEGPGRVLFAGQGAFYLGEIDGTTSQRVQDLAVRLSVFLPVRTTTNVAGYLWSKLGYANMLYLSALTNEEMVDVLSANRDIVVDLITEVYEAAAAENVILERFDGHDPRLYHPRERQDMRKIDASLDEVLHHLSHHTKKRTGAWHDIVVRHTRSEVDAHSGTVLRVAERHDIDLPLTRRMLELLHEIEDGRRRMCLENVELVRAAALPGPR